MVGYLRDLFINMTILISFISIASQMLRNKHFYDKPAIKTRIAMGLITGTLGCVLMFFSVRITDNTILDFRNMAIILSATMGGTITAFLTGSIIAIFRLLYFGVNHSSIIAIFVAVSITLSCSLICKCQLKHYIKWLLQTVMIIVITSIALFHLLGSRHNFGIIILFYGISHCVVSVITYSYVNYSLATNKLFQKLKNESSKDYLTGLDNVRQFDLILNELVMKEYKTKKSISFLMIDIDFFKNVNDTYGHVQGDTILKELGLILINYCKPKDHVFRNGGEEFSLLLSNCSNTEALSIAEKIRSQVEQRTFHLLTGEQIKITISIGVSTYPETVKDLSKLHEKADNALYEAKRSGRNKVCNC